MTQEEVKQLDQASISDLIRRAQQHDKEAFGMLYDHFYVPVYRYIYVRTGSKEESEDLTQVVFVRALGALARYEDKGKELLRYLYTIAHNAIIDARRKRHEVAIDDFARLPVEVGAIVESIRNAEVSSDAQQILACINELGEDQKQAMTLRFLADMTTPEIAEQMKKSVDAVRQLQSRAIRTIRLLLQKKGNGI